MSSVANANDDRLLAARFLVKGVDGEVGSESSELGRTPRMKRSS
jgi:hypothetical protein